MYTLTSCTNIEIILLHNSSAKERQNQRVAPGALQQNGHEQL